MRKRSDVDDFFDIDSGSVDGSDSGFSTAAGTLHINLDASQTEVVSDLCAVLSSHLGGVRSVLLRTSETHLTG